jgi:regulator of sigma E protease
LDGGKLLFLTIEKIRKKPVSQKIEEKITVFFFGLIMMLGILIIIKDIITRIS